MEEILVRTLVTREALGAEKQCLGPAAPSRKGSETWLDCAAKIEFAVMAEGCSLELQCGICVVNTALKNHAQNNKSKHPPNITGYAFLGLQSSRDLRGCARLLAQRRPGQVCLIWGISRWCGETCGISQSGRCTAMCQHRCPTLSDWAWATGPGRLAQLQRNIKEALQRFGNFLPLEL